MDGPPATFPVSPFPWDPRREGARVPDTLGCSLRKPLLESHPQAAWRAPWSLEPGSADPGRMEGWEEVLAQGQGITHPRPGLLITTFLDLWFLQNFS